MLNKESYNNFIYPIKLMRHPPDKAMVKTPLSLTEMSDNCAMYSAKLVASSSELSKLLSSPRLFGSPETAMLLKLLMPNTMLWTKKRFHAIEKILQRQFLTSQYILKAWEVFQKKRTTNVFTNYSWLMFWSENKENNW